PDPSGGNRFPLESSRRPYELRTIEQIVLAGCCVTRPPRRVRNLRQMADLVQHDGCGQPPPRHRPSARLGCDRHGLTRVVFRERRNRGPEVGAYEASVLEERLPVAGRDTGGIRRRRALDPRKETALPENEVIEQNSYGREPPTVLERDD